MTRKPTLANRKEIELLVRSKLHEMPFYDDRDPMIVVPLDEPGDLSIGYWKGNTRIGSDILLDMNKRGTTLFLLDIQIGPEYRGKGIGTRLYQVVEELALLLGCNTVRQTPSGTTITGETRASYLRRRGYTIRGFEAYKELK